MIDLLEQIERDRGIPVDSLCSALEEALGAAYREHAGESSVIARVDRASAAIALHRRRVVVDDVTDATLQISVIAAPQGYRPGDFFDERVEVGDFARVAALTAKRVLAQRVAEFERERIYEAYRARIGQLVTGLVQREIRGSVYVLFEDGNEGVLPAYARSPIEPIAINDMMVCEIEGVWRTTRGPAITLSRASESFVRKLFDVSYIVAGARRAGRATVLAATRTIAPSLIDGISQQIGGERIRIVPYSDDVDAMLALVLPDVIVQVHRDDATRTFVIATDDAVDVEIAAQLLGWRIIATRPLDFDEAIATIKPQAPRAEVAGATITDAMRREVEAFRAAMDAEA